MIMKLYVIYNITWKFKFNLLSYSNYNYIRKKKYHYIICSSFAKIFTKDNIFLNYQSCVSSVAHACVVKFVHRYIGICIQVLENR